MSAKNIMFSDRKEASFNLVTVVWTSYPNDQSLFELRKAGTPDDPRQALATNGKVYEVITELRRIANWLEAGP